MEKVNPYNQHNKLINTNDIVNIMETLNINDFKINDILLYQRSFVHKSYCIELYKDTDFKNIDDSLELQQISYETMEFLGDSILGSVVCSYLYERFYKIYEQNEGYLIISKHIEDNCDGRNNKNILEDVFEAFIGAVYLDNDYETVKKILLIIIEKYIDFTDIIVKNNNYKEQIIKYLQHNYKENPKFTDRDQDDNGFYYCDLYFKDELISSGTGKSKKKSQQDAAKNGLIHFNILNI